MPSTLLSVKDLKVNFVMSFGMIQAVKGLSFDLHEKQILGLIGESGSGKTTAALAITRLLPSYALVSGNITFYGKDRRMEILELSESELRNYRWVHVSLVFQGAMNALNPVLSVREHFKDTAMSHGIKDSKQIEKMASELLRSVRLDPSRVLGAYPHQLSGGMKQRVMIALALMLRPEVVIMDEPTTALDALTQRQILDLIKSIRDQYGTSILLITHDLSVIADTVDDVVVLYNGTPMEKGSVNEIFYEPLSPYTQMLIDSFPMIGRTVKQKGQILRAASATGCPYATNCPYATQECYGADMIMREVKPGHFSSCIKADQFIKEVKVPREGTNNE